MPMSWSYRAWGTDMKLAATLFLAAALCFGLAVREALAQQPTEEQRAMQQAVAEERSAHLSSLSDRAVQLRAEIAVLRLERAKLEAAAKECKPQEPKK